MSNYTRFRIEACFSDTAFRVQVKGRFMWRSGFMATDYFRVFYDTKQEALDAIEGYKRRFTEV